MPHGMWELVQFGILCDLGKKNILPIPRRVLEIPMAWRSQKTIFLKEDMKVN